MEHKPNHKDYTMTINLKNISLCPNPTIIIHTDGSCIGNPGHGGWSYIRHDHSDGILVQETMKSVYLHETTNNIAELLPVIHALENCPTGVPITICTDSKYVQDGCMKWLEGWKSKGWRKSDGKPIKNIALWIKIDGLIIEKTPKVVWVPAHKGVSLNEKADGLARDAADYRITIDETTYFDIEGNPISTPDISQEEQE